MWIKTNKKRITFNRILQGNFFVFDVRDKLLGSSYMKESRSSIECLRKKTKGK